MDPLTVTAAISVASRAFAGVKKMVEMGREAHDTFDQIGKWMSASHDVNKAKERAQHPSLFKKITAPQSAEAEALSCLVASKRLYEQRKELRTLIVMSYGKESWDELLAMEKKIRAERTRLIHDRIKTRQKMIDSVFIFSGITLIVALIAGTVYVVLQGGENA